MTDPFNSAKTQSLIYVVALLVLAGLSFIYESRDAKNQAWHRTTVQIQQVNRGRAWRSDFQRYFPNAPAMCDRAFISKETSGPSEGRVLTLVQKEKDGLWTHYQEVDFVEARSPTEVRFLACVKSQTREVRMSTAGGSAFRTDWQVALVNAANGHAVRRKHFVGPSPPHNTTEFHVAPGAGGHEPSSEAFNWIVGIVGDSQERVYFAKGDTTRLRFARDGQRIAITGGDVISLDVSTLKQVKKIDQPKTGRRGSVPSPDGNLLAWVENTGARGSKLHLLDTLSNEDTVLAEGYIGATAFSSDGRVVAWAGGEGYKKQMKITLWDLSKRRVLAVISNPGSVTALAWNETGELLVSGDAEGAIRFWDVQHGCEIDSTWVQLANGVFHQYKTPIVAISISAKPNRYLIVEHSDRSVFLWDRDMSLFGKPTILATRRTLWNDATFGGSEAFVYVSASPLSDTECGTIRRGNPEESRHPQTLYVDCKRSVISLAVAPDGTRVAALMTSSGRLHNVVKIWDFAD